MGALRELKSTTLADGVENSLLQYIQSSSLLPGDSLPKETELAAQLNVSRHIVREGISRLKTIGLIESRKHKGMILTRPNAFAGVSKLAEANLFSPDELREMMGIRVVMELGMAEFIYRKKTADQLAELRRHVGKEQSYQEIRLEIAFHTCLFAIGGNAMANQFQQILATAFSSRALSQSNERLHTPTHRQICDTLEKGTEEDFRRILREHLAPYICW